MHPASFNQLAKETRYSRGSFARNSSRQKTPITESPPSVKQSRTTSNPERCSFVAFEPPKVSLPVDLHFLPHASNAPSLVSRLTLRLSMSVDNRTSNQTSALKRKKMFLARVEWLPVTSRSHRQTSLTHSQTNVRLVLGVHLVQSSLSFNYIAGVAQIQAKISRARYCACNPLLGKGR